MQITVLGEATAAFRPERATVHLELGFEAPDQQTAVQRATVLANEFAAHVDELRGLHPAPVTWSALLPIATRHWRPYSHDGAVLPMRHGAAASAKVKFQDFQALSRFIDVWGSREGVTVAFVEWNLTQDARRREEAAVLSRAVENARDRAQVMADAAGAGQVRFLEIADPGLLVDGAAEANYGASAKMMRAAYDGGGEGVNLRPEDVELEAHVHARFTTD